jgi:hypothetical protein
VRLGGADKRIVEHSPVGEKFLSETVVVRACHDSSFGRVRTAQQTWSGLLCNKTVPSSFSETPRAPGRAEPATVTNFGDLPTELRPVSLWLRRLRFLGAVTRLGTAPGRR